MHSVQSNSIHSLSTSQIDSSATTRKYAIRTGSTAAIGAVVTSVALAVILKKVAIYGFLLASVASGPACPIILGALVVIALISFAAAHHYSAPQIMKREMEACKLSGAITADSLHHYLQPISNDDPSIKANMIETVLTDPTDKEQGIAIQGMIDDREKGSSKIATFIRETLPNTIEGLLPKKTFEDLTDGEIYTVISESAKRLNKLIELKGFEVKGYSLSLVLTVNDRIYTANAGSSVIALRDSNGLQYGSSLDNDDHELRIAGPFRRDTNATNPETVLLTSESHERNIHPSTPEGLPPGVRIGVDEEEEAQLEKVLQSRQNSGDSTATTDQSSGSEQSSPDGRTTTLIQPQDVFGKYRTA